MRLGFFVDAAFRSEGTSVMSGSELFGFTTFACAVGSRFDRFLLIARGSEDVEATPFALPAGVEHAALPDYGSLKHLGAVLGAIPGTVRTMWRALAEVDLVWVSAANPLGLLLVALARLRGKRVAILVRQDSMAYFRTRLPSRAWLPLLAPLWLVNWAYRWLGRCNPTTAVGVEIARAYGAPRPNVLEFEVNLVSETEIPAAPPRKEPGGAIRLLTVGRIEPEKSPQVLIDALAILDRAEPGRFGSTWVGEGRLREELRRGAEERGIGERIELPGYVPFGEGLLDFYKEADLYVHVALTEGVPGVICEAMAAGLPVIASDVGGIRAATSDGEAALLVPPRDPAALADAIQRLSSDAALRDRLAVAGLARARRNSIDVQSARVAAFLGAAA